MEFAKAHEAIREALNKLYRGHPPEKVVISRRHLTLLLEDWEKLDTSVRAIAAREGTRETLRGLARAGARIRQRKLKSIVLMEILEGKAITANERRAIVEETVDFVLRHTESYRTDTGESEPIFQPTEIDPDIWWSQCMLTPQPELLPRSREHFEARIARWKELARAALDA